MHQLNHPLASVPLCPHKPIAVLHMGLIDVTPVDLFTSLLCSVRSPSIPPPPPTMGRRCPPSRALVLYFAALATYILFVVAMPVERCAEEGPSELVRRSSRRAGSVRAGLFVNAQQSVVSAAPLPECRRLKDVVTIPDFERDGLDEDSLYFCQSDVPLTLRCTCGSASICRDQASGGGRNVGECACCSAWVFFALTVLVVLVVATVGFCVYALCCRGTWWFDGVHSPIFPILPRRSTPQVAPGTLPLPSGIFRGFRSVDFETGVQRNMTATATARSAAGRRERLLARRQARQRLLEASGAASPAAAAGADSDVSGDEAEPPPATTGVSVTVRVADGVQADAHVQGSVQ